MSELLKEFYRNTVYTLKSLVWRPQNIHEDILDDRLSRYCLTLGDLNTNLDGKDGKNFPVTVGRFPKILREYKDLTFVILNAIEEFERDNKGKQLNRENEKNMLTDYLSNVVAERISDDPHALKRILDSNGFYQ
ncbi:MAG: hypothetical protein WC867_02180 [Candidatus Pacearchaeota archaeon]|jgi:hypothetical protein